MAAPVVHEDALVAVLECVNKTDETAFDEDDLFFLTMMTQTASGALHNASLMEAEKKIEILETLVEVSNEITSTLNLERVLQVVVNSPQRIMSLRPGDGGAGKKGQSCKLKAMSGTIEIVHSDPQMRILREMLEFCLAIRQAAVRGGAWRHGGSRPRGDAAEVLRLLQGNGRARVVLGAAGRRPGPAGRAGRSRAPTRIFSNEAQFEFIDVLASQATVALRNASLYEEVPLIGVLEPLLERKRRSWRWGRSGAPQPWRWRLATALFLMFVPLPMRVVGRRDGCAAEQRGCAVGSRRSGAQRLRPRRRTRQPGHGAGRPGGLGLPGGAGLGAGRRDTAVAAMNRALAANDGTRSRHPAGAGGVLDLGNEPRARAAGAHPVALAD